MPKSDAVTIITLDGPSGVGKTTVASLLAEQLHYHILVSGLLYRMVAWISLQSNIEVHNIAALVQIPPQLKEMNIRFSQHEGKLQTFVNEQDQTEVLLAESCAARASQIACIAELRSALLPYQNSFARAPGLIAEGRDMGTIVFPQAHYKIFLTATLEERASRRYKQLKNSCIGDTLNNLKRQISLRDERDKQRKIAPLTAAEDAVVFDTTGKQVHQLVEQILCLVKGL